MTYRPRSPRNGARSRQAPRGGSAGGRGGYGPPPRNSAAPTIVAIVVVVAVVGLVIALASGKKSDPKPERQAPPAVSTTGTPDGPPQPSGPRRLPVPELDYELNAEARKLAHSFKDQGKVADALYQEALRAHQAGDDDLWQEKLKEASQVLAEIQDAWNDIIVRMPSNDDWDEEMVANHYLGREQDQVRRVLKIWEQIRKQRVLNRGD